jgi:hypothetical protein
MSLFLNMTRDVTGATTYGRQESQDIYQTNLAANVNQSFTVPSNNAKWLAIFSFDPGLRVFVNVNATATVPGSSFARGGGELNPTAFQVNAGDVINFITPDAAAYVTASLYAIP